MVDQELADSCQVLTYLCRHDVERATQRQHGIHILDMRIERERTVSADAVIAGEFLHVDDHSNEITQASLMEHGSLGFTSRTGGVNHVCETVG